MLEKHDTAESPSVLQLKILERYWLCKSFQKVTRQNLCSLNSETRFSFDPPKGMGRVLNFRVYG